MDGCAGALCEAHAPPLTVPLRSRARAACPSLLLPTPAPPHLPAALFAQPRTHRSSTYSTSPRQYFVLPPPPPHPPPRSPAPSAAHLMHSREPPPCPCLLLPSCVLVPVLHAASSFSAACAYVIPRVCLMHSRAGKLPGNEKMSEQQCSMGSAEWRQKEAQEGCSGGSRDGT